MSRFNSSPLHLVPAEPVVTTQRIPLPACDEPYWFRDGNPLANYQSSRVLPTTADVVIIGAGLTGASAAYHLADAVGNGKLRVVILDQGDPAGEASGRNGGNFELIPENCVGAYEGLAKERFDFLRRLYRDVPSEILHAESERQASQVLGIVLRNRELMKEIILREQIECDFAPRGWLHMASSEEEEQGICAEVMLAAQHGERVEIWPRGKIREELGIETPFLGRFVPGDGTYHPFKYTCGLLQQALRAGVQLFTRVRVQQVISSSATRHAVVTPRGTIATRSVIVATNAFTSTIFPELQAIRAFQSQIMVTENAIDRTRGRVITCNAGPVFVNQPRGAANHGRAPLLLGGGRDRPMRNPASRRRSTRIHDQLLAQRDRMYPELRGQAPSAEWIGPMGFTPDQLPALGLLRPGVVIVAGFNGYGGSYTTAAGLAAVEMVHNGAAPEWVPPDVFSPRRLLNGSPIFMSERESLWRIAQTLCDQLRRVDRQIEELLALRPRNPRAEAAARKRVSAAKRERLSPDLLRGLEAFARFTTDDLATLAKAMRRIDLRRGAVLYKEGSIGDSCFVVLSGTVALTTQVRAHKQLLALLSEGKAFGQDSMIDKKPRFATCTIERDAVLAEIDRRACSRLLHNSSPIGLKVLALLNEGLIAALRAADLQLMRINDT